MRDDGTGVLAAGREAGLVDGRHLQRVLQGRSRARVRAVTAGAVCRMAITAMDACAGRLLCAAGRRATVVDAAAVAVRAEFAGRHVLTGRVWMCAAPSDADLTMLGAVFYPVDAGLLVVADRSGHVRLVDGSRMESALDLPVSSEMIGHLAISPANPTVVGPPAIHHARWVLMMLQVVACSVSEEAGVRLVDLRSGARTHVLAYPSGARVTALAWSPCDPHVCVAGYTDEHVLLWDIRRPGVPDDERYRASPPCLTCAAACQIRCTTSPCRRRPTIGVR